MPSRLYKILLPLIVLAVIIGVAIFWLTYTAPKNLEIDYLDVGQGDAELIQTPYGQNILIDGGPDSSVLRSLSFVLPWWDRTLDLVILTHPHDDHVAGLNDILKRYRVRKIVMTGVNHTSPAYLKFLENVRDDRIPVTLIDRPQTIALGPDLKLEIIWPDQSLANQEVENLNNTSIVCRLEFRDKKFLFTGDIEDAAEKSLLALPARLRADVLKVSHHGSAYTTSAEFLAAVQPQIAVIEVGADNKFGHPTPRTLNRLEKTNAIIYRTDEKGTIKIFSDGRTVWQE